MTAARAYYNEINPHAAQTLRNLIAGGHIAPGDLDDRSIKDVHPDDLKPYTQCHFFAGIGIWSLALRRAEWPDELPVWTGSCPCQPYSKAGKGLGFTDERDLRPDWFHLIQERQPAEVLGEQVGDAIKKQWRDRNYADMETEGYALGRCVLVLTLPGRQSKDGGSTLLPSVSARVWKDSRQARF
ncbi:DNA cytosine methyltransferase [Pseudomonas sp. C9-3]|uniref:DNA cytosine methyltransferase n=1 Tax=Pseudomonas sp. C9-3 TaxID=3078264 RepID=UPI0028E5A488|nr:DNA cytosine methyltransferase [Pseudomonas sp. C9-3]